MLRHLHPKVGKSTNAPTLRLQHEGTFPQGGFQFCSLTRCSQRGDRASSALFFRPPEPAVTSCRRSDCSTPVLRGNKVLVRTAPARSKVHMASSRINFDWFLSSAWDACAEMEACVWDRTADVQFSACFLPPLHISNSHPGIISQILSLFVLPWAMYNQNEAPGPALLGCYLERKQTFLHCWVMPVLSPAILLWRSK